MKKYICTFSYFGGSELGVYADTKEEARQKALEHVVSKVERELEVLEMKARTERCDICQYTYPPSDIVKEKGEELCISCYEDKYGFGELSPEDIPF